MRKTAKRGILLSAFLCPAIALLSLGGIAGVPADAAQRQREVTPYARYSFDGAEDSGAWLHNSGTSGAAYNLQKTQYARRENWGENNGGVNFSDNGCLYLTGDKYIFNELNEFTVSVKFYATRNPYWYSSLFSWDVLAEESATNMTRFSIGYKTGQDWLRYSDVGILGSRSQENTNGMFFSKGEPLLTKNADNDNSGWWNFIYSVKPGGVAITYLATGTSNVNHIKAFRVPENYSLKSENAVFSIGGSFSSQKLSLEYKANAILDDVRIYDFAMTEEQMDELRWTDKVCESDVVISSEIEHGSVTASKTRAKNGERILLGVTPDDGYTIGKVTVNGEEIIPLDGVYYTHMTKAGMSVSAEFIRKNTENSGGDSDGNNPGGDPSGGDHFDGDGENGEKEKGKGCSSSVGGFACGAAILSAGAAVAFVTMKTRRAKKGGRGDENK